MTKERQLQDIPRKLITAVMRLDRGAGNFYVMKVSKARVALINTVHDECLKAWIASTAVDSNI